MEKYNISPIVYEPEAASTETYGLYIQNSSTDIPSIILQPLQLKYMDGTRLHLIVTGNSRFCFFTKGKPILAIKGGCALISSRFLTPL